MGVGSSLVEQQLSALVAASAAAFQPISVVSNILQTAGVLAPCRAFPLPACALAERLMGNTEHR